MSKLTPFIAATAVTRELKILTDSLLEQGDGFYQKHYCKLAWSLLFEEQKSLKELLDDATSEQVKPIEVSTVDDAILYELGNIVWRATLCAVSAIQHDEKNQTNEAWEDVLTSRQFLGIAYGLMKARQLPALTKRVQAQQNASQRESQKEKEIMMAWYKKNMDQHKSPRQAAKWAIEHKKTYLTFRTLYNAFREVYNTENK